MPNASAIDRIYDLNFSQGGPIKKDKLWFFTTARQWSVNAPIAGTFVTDGSGPAIASCLQAAKTSAALPAGHRRPEDQERAGPADVAGQPEEQVRGLLRRDRQVPRSRDVRGRRLQHRLRRVELAGLSHRGREVDALPVSNRLFIEAGYSNNTEDYTNESHAGREQGARFSQAWYAGAARRDLDLVSTSDQPLISNISTQSPLRYNLQGVGLVRHGLAQLEVRRPADIGAFRAHPRRQRRPRPAVSQPRDRHSVHRAQQRRHLQHTVRLA